MRRFFQKEDLEISKEVLGTTEAKDFFLFFTMCARDKCIGTPRVAKMEKKWFQNKNL